MNLYQQYIAKSKYARYLDDKQRREHWPETVARYFQFMDQHLSDMYSYTIPKELREELEAAVLNLEVMPSMRLMMTAGEACMRQNMTSYNCSAVAVDDQKAFDEAMYVLMCGSGVGFSVERQFVNKLPEVPDQLFKSDTTIVVKDSKEGWAKALRQLIALLYSGEIPKWDLSKVRKAGSRLKTFGGRSSGPDVLEELFNFFIRVFRNAEGRKLTSLECHDLMCKIAEVVVVGGVRRCLPKGTFVDTNLGPKRIEEIKVGDLVKTEQGLYQPVVATENVGQKEIVNVKTNIGVFQSTKEHRWAILSDFKTGVADYKTPEQLNSVEDRLVFVEGANEGIESHFPEYIYNKSSKHSTTCKDINVSALNSVEWSWFLGLIQGDGYVALIENDTKGVVSIAIPYDMPETKNKVENYFNRLGVNFCINTDEAKDRCWKIRTSSKQLAEYLSQFKHPKTSLEIPDFIMQGSIQMRSAYLAGIFDSDGSCKFGSRQGRKPFVVVSTVYTDYAAQIRALVASLGIPSGVRVTDRSKNNWQNIQSVLVKGPDYKDALAELLVVYSEKIVNDYNKCSSKRDWFSLPKSMFKKLRLPLTGIGPTTSWNKVKSESKHVPVTFYGWEEAGTAECYDIQVANTECFTTNGLLTHNSALISLSNLSDDRMRKAKSGEWWTKEGQRSLANNSAVYTEKPDVGTFMQEWLSLYESKSGERGIFNRQAAELNAQRTGRRKEYEGYLTNPCQPSRALLLTPEGIRELGDILPGDTVWSGKQWTKVVDKWSTGVKPVYKYITTAGFIESTENHRVLENGLKVEVQKAQAIDLAKREITSVTHLPSVVCSGWVIGDGYHHHGYPLIVIGEDDQDIWTSEVAQFLSVNYSNERAYKVTTDITPEELPRIYNRVIPDRFVKGTPDIVASFLRGLYSANGSICGGRITLKSTSKVLIEQVQTMLSSLGIHSYFTTNVPTEIEWENGIYTSKESYDLNIGYMEGKLKFQALIGFVHKYKQEKLANILEGAKSRKYKSTYEIIAKEYKGEEEVFDITVEADEHTYWCGGLLVSNCGEITLRSQGLCNLSEVVIRPEDTEDDLRRKVRLATIIGTFQSTLTYFPYVRKQWQKNAEEERLLGVSFTGIMDNKLTIDPDISLLEDLKKFAVDVNRVLAEELGINQSASITTVKPSGTVSQLVNCSSGIHGSHAPYYIRRVRGDNKDPLTKFMIDKGIPYEPCVMRPESTTVFSFPQKSGAYSKLRTDMTALEQLDVWLKYKLHWTEHNPSVTVSVKEDEWVAVGAWVYEHFDEVQGVSFLPHDGGTYRQAPYEEITEEQYLEALEKMPISLDWDQMVEVEDNVEGAQNLACTGGFCEL